MNAQHKINLRKLYLIVLSWTILGGFLSIYDHWTLISHFSAGSTDEYSFLSNLAFNMFAGFIGGLMGGVFLVFVFNRKLRSAPYLNGIAAVCITYIFIVTIITFLMATLQSLFENGFILFSEDTYSRIRELVYTTQHLKNILFWAFIVALTQFTLLVNDKFGQGLLWSIVKGKYHFPRAEERIFMFLDLKSSTSIAESLGNLKYHQLLKSLFADITDPILNCKGQIYQYVGDEVVISWRMPDGLEENNCIECYFAIKEKLESERVKYETEYGLLPEFKAGIHYGKVIAGEIGIIKRDITYSGDTLNTTARIQGQCNEYSSAFLSSKKLINLIHVGSHFKVTSIGSIPLKGKENDVELIAIQKT
ncbi:MAG: adenylate/guanylate cyclase domain-containing protein [Balneolaceae bacterium]